MKSARGDGRGGEAAARGRSPGPQAARYAAFLSEEGYRPKVEPGPAEETSMLVFKAEGTLHLLSVLEDDPDFFHLTVCYDTTDRSVGLPALLEEANRCNRTWKGVKVAIDPDDGSAEFHCESFLANPEDFGSVLRRSISALDATAAAFFSELGAGAA